MSAKPDVQPNVLRNAGAVGSEVGRRGFNMTSNDRFSKLQVRLRDSTTPPCSILPPVSGSDVRAREDRVCRPLQRDEIHIWNRLSV